MRNINNFFILLLLLVFNGSLTFPQETLLSATVAASREYKQYRKATKEARNYIREVSNGAKTEVIEMVPEGKRKAVELIVGSLNLMDQIIEALEDFAAYFSFWEAYFYVQIDDVTKAKKKIEEIASKYKEAKAGQIGEEILKVKSKGKFALLVMETFKTLPDPMEILPSQREASKETIRNKLREFFKKQRVYKDWQEYDGLLRKTQSGVEIKVKIKQENLLPKIETTVQAMVKRLDEEIALRLIEKGGQLTVVNLVPSFPNKDKYLEQSRNCYKAAADRFPSTRAGKFAKEAVKNL